MSFIVGIGTSAGGLEALNTLFSTFKSNCPIAFVVVMHLSPDHDDIIPQILGRHTELQAVRATDSTIPQPGFIYVIPPGHELTLRAGRLSLKPYSNERELNLPINIFFASLAEELREEAVAVVLTGAGSDGSLGIQDVHSMGGYVIVQDPATAAFSGMPSSAIGTGVIDTILPIEAIGPAIEALVSGQLPFGPAREETATREVLEPQPTELREIISLLQEHTGFDFGGYKTGTLIRRIARRMILNKTHDPREYVGLLRSDHEELERLSRDMLVRVTRFFRDPEVFEVLAQRVIPEIVKNRQADGLVRIWVPGCSSGEEAWTLAMLVTEALEAAGTTLEVRIFATDVDREALGIAANGVYSAASVAVIPEAFREKYFIESHGFFSILPQYRHIVVFAPHNVVTDPPFTRLDLISFRNVLIYLQPETQRHVLSQFAFSLRPDGFLVLGASETIGDLVASFKAVDYRYRVYRNRGNSTGRASTPYRTVGMVSPARRPGIQSAIEPDGINMRVQAILQSAYIPPSLVIAEDFSLIHTFGAAGNLLSVYPGKASLNILSMVPRPLAAILGAGVARALRDQTEVISRDLQAVINGRNLRFTLHIRPLDVLELARQQAVVASFEQVREVGDEPDSPPAPNPGGGEDVERLQRELVLAREDLQAIIEELETSNEALQTTNEELITSNEELQSTNEELQSVNEELSMVNSEYEHRIQELNAITHELEILLHAVRIGLIVLDGQLRIIRYTESINDVFHLIPSDKGRLFTHITHEFQGIEIEALCRSVLAQQQPQERRVRSRQGASYLLRVVSIREGRENGARDAGQGEAGLVVFLADISDLDRLNSALAQAIESLPEATAIIAPQGEIIAVNRSWRLAVESLQPGLCWPLAVGDSLRTMPTSPLGGRVSAHDRLMGWLEGKEGISWSDEVVTEGTDRKVFAVRCQVLPNALGLLVQQRDITSLRLMEQGFRAGQG